jgi:hypothetical protein
VLQRLNSAVKLIQRTTLAFTNNPELAARPENRNILQFGSFLRVMIAASIPVIPGISTSVMSTSGYMTLDPGDCIVVSKCIREEFENGKDYYKLEGQLVREPSQV